MPSFPSTLTRIPAAVAVALGLLSCATNPVTGKSELAFVSESQEIAMGRDYAVQVKQETGVYPDSAVQAYVSRIGLAIARTTERPSLPWAFTVMDDPQVNAFALPGGPIFVTRGILTHMNSEAELAAVIGHEIGHVTARHSVQQMTRQQLTQLGMVAGAIVMCSTRGAGYIDWRIDRTERSVFRATSVRGFKSAMPISECLPTPPRQTKTST